MRLWWRRKEENGHESRAASVARAEAEAKLRATQRMTPAVERMADRLADLPDEEFAERVARAFRRRPA